MSAIAGVYSRSGAPVDQDILARLGAALADMGPDDEMVAVTPQVGMIHRPFRTDRRLGTTPHLAQFADGWLVSFDGRLDNVPAVCEQMNRMVSHRLSEAELLLAVYREWGTKGFSILVGDFAASLWDADEQRLVLCCDSMGRRPLYYHETASSVIWSSRCDAIVSAARLPPVYDEEFIADFLAGRPSVHSPIRGIHALCGAHAFSATRCDSRLERYWTFDPRREIRYRYDEEYESHFRELFEQAVGCRLETHGPVYCELSGGLDSSSIFCVADRLLRQGRASTPALHSVSYVFDHSVRSDERVYIEPVASQVGRDHLQISETDYPILAPIPESLRPDRPTAELCFLARQDCLTREMNARGARVLLSGLGGDQAFWASPPAAVPLADLLVQRRIVELFRSGREWSRSLRWPLARTLWIGGCWPALPRRWQARTQRSSPRGDWYTHDFVERTDFNARAWLSPDDLGFARPSQSWHYSLIRGAMRHDVTEWCSNEGYLDVRLPYLDRRLVAFALAIPVEQMVRLRETRSIVRRALKGIVPEAVRRRSSKAGPSQAFLNALNREWPRLSPLMAAPRVAEYGWVDRDAFAAAIDRARHGIVTNLGELGATIALELWLRTVERRSPRAGSGDAAPPRWRLNREFTNHDGGVYATRPHL